MKVSFKNKQYLFFFIIIFSFTKGFSQNEIDFEEHRKYWYYKKRLHDKFVNVGLQGTVDCNSSGGQSIPASRYNGTNLYYDEDNLMWFGQYIGVLATEFKLLNDREEWSQAEDAKRELYHALMAYERLDRKSETLPYIFDSPTPTPNCNAGVNGFFIRGDVAAPSWYNVGYNYTATNANCGGLPTDQFYDCGYYITPDSLWRHLNKQHPEFYSQYNNVWHDPTMDYFYRLKCCERLAGSTSDPNIVWLANQLNLTRNSAQKWGKMNFYPSQDQIASLFMGFALIEKCMGGITYNDGSANGYHFKNKAIYYTDLITTYLRNNDWLGKLEDEDGTPHQWGRTFRYEAGYGIAKAASAITGNSYLGTGDIATLAKSKLYWEYLAHPYVGTALLATVNTWPIDGLTVVGSPFTYMAYKANVKGGYHANFMQLYAAIAGSWINADHILADYGALTDQGINSLLHAFLHDKTVGTALGKNYFKSRIEDAPCKGPRYKPVGESNYTGVAGWRGRNRWWHPKESLNKEGHFNGLDYMILFNLYNLVYDDEAYDNYRNVYLDDNTVSGPMPILNPPSCLNEYSYLSFNDITVENAWLRNNTVTLKAQNKITFKDGFNTTALSSCYGVKNNKFHAYIGEVNCSDNPTDYFRPANSGGDDSDYTDEIPEPYYAQPKDNAEEVEEIDVVSNYISIFPNPTKGIFTVESSNTLTEVEVYNIYGTLFSKQSYSETNTSEIDLSTFQSGIYYVHITSGEEAIIKKIVKQ